MLDFIEVVDPISDYKLNYALMQNCGDFIEQSCKMEEGETDRQTGRQTDSQTSTQTDSQAGRQT